MLCVCVHVCACVAVLSERSAEDCPLYGAHGQTGLALLQWGAPLLKFTLSLLKVARNSMLSLSILIHCVLLSHLTCFTFCVGVQAILSSIWVSSLIPLYVVQAYVCVMSSGCVHNHHVYHFLHSKTLHEEGWLGGCISSQLPLHGVAHHKSIFISVA